MSSNWQHQLERIAERAKNILQTGLWSDCTFIVGIAGHQKEFKAHKLILSMSSAVFDRMLNGSLKEQDPNNIEVVDIQPEAFSSLLKYIYTDEIEIQSFDQACELCYVANKYMLPNLVQHCIAYIWKDINFTNACRAYEFAMLFDQQGIAEDCKKIIFSQTSDIIEHQSFKDIEKDTLYMILQQDELSIKSEKQLFDAVENWIEAEFERQEVTEDARKKEIHAEIIANIRFLSMHPQEFAEGPATSPYFSKEDSYAIIMNLVTNTSPVSLPKNFSEKKRVLRDKQNSNETDISWELKYPAQVEVSAQSEYAILISCNKDIQIFGLKVIGNLLPSIETESCYLDSHPFVYSRPEEGIIGFIENLNSTSCRCITEKHSSGYREYLYLNFCKPYNMVHGKYYKIGIRFIKPGLYIQGTFDYDSLLYKSLTFDFQKPEVEVLLSICGITFRLQNQNGME